jgi:hypothetical protein
MAADSGITHSSLPLSGRRSRRRSRIALAKGCRLCVCPLLTADQPPQPEVHTDADVRVVRAAFHSCRRRSTAFRSHRFPAAGRHRSSAGRATQTRAPVAGSCAQLQRRRPLRD